MRDVAALDDALHRAGQLLDKMNKATDAYERTRAEVNKAVADAEMDFNRKKNHYEVTTAQIVADARAVLDAFRDGQKLVEKAAREVREGVLQEMTALQDEIRGLGVELDLNPGVRNRL